MCTKTPANTAWNEDGTELIFRGRGAESRAYRVVHVVRNDGKSDTCPEFTPVYLFDALPRVAARGHMLHKIATESAENKTHA